MESRTWWCSPLIPALRKKGKRTSEFEASLIYMPSSRLYSKPCIKQTQKHITMYNSPL